MTTGQSTKSYNRLSARVIPWTWGIIILTTLLVVIAELQGHQPESVDNGQSLHPAE